jgi:hypothetical protein
VFRLNDGEEAGHGNDISGDDGLMADCVIMCFFSMVRSIWFFSVYLSFCLFVILFPLVSTEGLRVDEVPVDRLWGSEVSFCT